MFKRTGYLALMVLTTTMGCGADSGSTNAAAGAYDCISGQEIDCAAVAELRDGNGLVKAPNSVVSVPLGNVQTGQHVDMKFSLGNTAAAVSASLLQIGGIRVGSKSGGAYEAATAAEAAEGPAFQCFGPDGTTPCDQMVGKWPKVAPAGVTNNSPAANWTNKLDFVIRYKRYDDQAREATVMLRFVGDPKWKDAEFPVRIGTALGSPNIQLSPSTVAFDAVAPGSDATEEFKVTNTGDALLEVRSFVFVADNNFTLIVDNGGGVQEHKPNGAPIKFEPTIPVKPNESATFKVKFAAKDDAQRQGTIVIETNDVSTDDGKDNKLIITANAHLPCMKLEPSGKLDFGGIKLGEPTEKELTIRNCGGVPLIVEKLEFDDAGTNSSEFALSYKVTNAKFPEVDATKGPTKEKPLVIKVNETAPIGVIYTPSDESPIDPATKQPKPDIATVKVTSNAYSAKDSVVCEGTGVTKTCPTAKIGIKEGEEVIPQTMLHLKGDGSQATGGGQVKKYKWTAKQPAGSNQVFVPGPTFPNPTFTANAAGEYEFCLEVWDQNDVKSCNPGCVTVLVLPEEAIHVELLWKTPADPDETDTGPAAGADMDLHFTHPLALGPDLDCDGKPDPWFSNPFDTFWFNPNPNWGSANAQVNDDPSLDLDDTDGGGPENLNLDDPEGTIVKPTQYSVGVHYWNDHGFKESQATVNIYIMGVLALQISKVKMNVLDMWYVGKINWPNTMSSGTLDPFQICFQNGDPCSGGKRWLPKGDYCITPCYVNPSFTATQSGANAAACKKKP